MARPEYSGPEWQRVRLMIVRRDGYRCQIKLANCKGKATEVDHVVSLTNGGARLDPANLRAACKSCNISARNSDVAARARGQSSSTMSGPSDEPPSGWLLGIEKYHPPHRRGER